MITYGVFVVVRRWLLVLIVVLLPLCYGGIVSISGHKLDDVYMQLMQLNKPALKSIKSPDGDIIDCVHISHQPAFDHPLLKNHTIQMRPSYHPEGLFEENKQSIPNSNDGISKSITQLWHLNGRCPEETIPIRRTKMKEILRASSINSFGKKQHGTIPKPTMFTEPEPINLSGHEAGGIRKFSFRMAVNQDYFTTCETRRKCPEETIPIRRTKMKEILRASSINSFGKKQHGTIPKPTMFTEPEPINLSGHEHAIGFVQGDEYYGTKATMNVWKPILQQSKEFSLSQLWIIAGSYPSDINTVEAGWQDPRSGDWWLQYGNELVGYWPTSLFSYLADSASQIQWGGEVLNFESGGQHTTTQMGSGHFPEEGFGKASFMKNIQIVDGSNHLIAPIGVGTFAEQSNCYNVQMGNDGDWGNYIYYGGPGRNPSCP
ncbi:hypothetical protein TEA_008612 [Camellia sinensis var. sinensis]|uniref:Neprosin PEP catalytic domain-containing protein n=1 Tax=Camellia sinensis var. sinensis TaxID=542762 RepID=A0A4S4EC69_CAMSN|nr:hypothetical protein TEA_008612 [Camellia sinensis var. sinensis]